MTKKLLPVLALICWAGTLLAQIAAPCDPPGTTVPAENCQSACINCNFNGYSGTTAGWGPDGEPPGWCSQIQNDQWLGFIANCSSATFTVTPSNCSLGAGVQAAVYPAGCNDQPLGCNGGCDNCGTTPTVFSVTGMIPGSNYYLIIDGYSADQCDFSITVSPPSCVQAPNVGVVGQMSGPTSICPGATATYAIPATTGAGFYTWTSNVPGVEFNGIPSPATLEAPTGRTVSVTFPPSTTPYSVQICVQPTNSCNTGAQRCKTVNVAPIPITTLPKVTVCAENAPYNLPWGDQADVSGNYTHTYTSFRGCDSVVQKQVVVKQPIFTNVVRSICEGSSVTICGIDFSDSGVHSQTCTSFQGCDSTVNLTLNVLAPVAEILGPTQLSCGNASITLSSAASPNQPFPTNKLWRNLATGQTFNGPTLTVTAPGTYVLTATMSAGATLTCVKSDTIVITGNTTPPTAVGVNGVIGCNGATAIIGVTTNATSPTFTWAGPGGFVSTAQSPTVGLGGTYTVTVTNGGNGCTSTATATVGGNTTPPTATATGTTLTCANPSLSVSATSNVANATFSWSGPNGYAATGATPLVTTTGTYVVTVLDPSNQCTTTATAVVDDNVVLPSATASVSGPIGCNSPSVALTASSGTASGFSWSGPNGYVATGANPSANEAGTYTVTVTSNTNGCQNTATVSVTGNTNLPTASVTNAVLSCSIASDTLFGSSATPGVTYQWSGTGISTNPSLANVVVTQPGSFTLTVTATNNCTATATATVGGNFAAPQASATGGTISCSANTTTINGTSSTPGATFDWVGPNGAPYSGQSVNVSEVGDYTLVVTGTNGCTQTATATVTPDVNLPNVAAVGDTLNCLINSVTIDGSSSTPGVTYTWTAPSGVVLANPNAEDQTVTAPGTYTLTVFNPANNCAAVASAFVALDNAAPGASTSDDILTCASPTLQLFASTGATVQNPQWNWSGPNGYSSTDQNPTVTAAGTYTVTVTSPENGCQSTATATVAANQNIPVLTTAATTLTCDSTTITINSTSNLPVTFDWTGPSGFVSALQNPTTQLPGLYTLTATASNGCSSIATITVNQDVATPNVSVLGDTITCAQPVAALTGGSSTAGTTFEWFNQSGSSISTQQNTTVSQSGVYSLVVTAGNGCKSTQTATVAQNVEQPVVQIANPQTLTCSRTLDTLQMTVITTLSTVQTIAWTGPAAFSSALEDPEVGAPGTYNVTVTSANGCTTTTQIAVNQNIAPPNVSAAGGTLDCATTTFNLNGGSTTTSVDYAWSGPNSFTAVVEDPAVTAPGAYLLTVTGSNGCTSSATATVAIDTLSPGASIASSNILTCADQTATLTASTTSGTQYVWVGTGLGGQTTSTVLVDLPGSYQVIITGANGCTSSFTFDQNEDVALPTASAEGDTLNCISGAGTVIGTTTTAGSSFAWTGPNNFTSNVAQPTVTVAGVYTLAVTGPNGCVETTTATVAENNDSPEVNISGNGILTCDNTSVTFTGVVVTPNCTVEWTRPDGSTVVADSIVATEPGEYLFTVTSLTNGCVSAPSINLGQNIQPPLDVTATLTTAGSQLDCTHPTVALSGNSSTVNVTYAWTGPGGFTSDVPNPTVGTAGTYDLLVTSVANGCTATASVDVTQDPDIPEVSVTTDTITCAVTSVTLDAESNTAGVNFTWSGPNGFTSTLEDPNTTVSGAYSVTVTDPNNGCTITSQIVVPQNTVAPGVTVANDTITCAQPSIALTGNSGTSGVTYLWTAPNGQTYNTQAPTISQPGPYVLLVTAPNGCTSQATAQITPDQNIPVVTVAGGTITCLVTSVQLSGAADKPNVTWAWSGPNGFTSTEQNPTITTSGTYTLVVSTTNGCSGQAVATVLNNTTAPTVNTTTPDELDCNTTQVSLGASVPAAGNYSFVWTTANGSIASGANSSTPTVTQAGQYTVLVTNTTNGCTATANVPVTVDPAVPSAVALSPRGVSCFGYTNGTVTLGNVTGGTAPFLFSLDNQPFIAATAYTALPPGPHTLRIQDANGCELETSFEISEPPLLVVNLGPDTIIRLGDAVVLSVNNTVSDPGSVAQTQLVPNTLDTLLGQSFVPPYSLQYALTVVDSNGCKASDERRIIVDRTRRVYVPNAFNPNGSGSLNASAFVSGGNDVQLIRSFSIYDRWGEAVFQAKDFLPNDPSKGWDGRLKGKEVNPAVFVYVVEVLFKDGETELFSGDVTVVRD